MKLKIHIYSGNDQILNKIMYKEVLRKVITENNNSNTG